MEHFPQKDEIKSYFDLNVVDRPLGRGGDPAANLNGALAVRHWAILQHLKRVYKFSII